MSKFIIHPDADILAMLKAKGYSSYVVRRDRILGESTMQKFRGDDKQLPSWAELAKLVSLLHVSPAALIAYQTDDGRIYDLTGQRIQTASEPEPQPQPQTHIIHGHPGDNYLPDDFWLEHEDDPAGDGGTWINSAPDD